MSESWCFNSTSRPLRSPKEWEPGSIRSVWLSSFSIHSLALILIPYCCKLTNVIRCQIFVFVCQIMAPQLHVSLFVPAGKSRFANRNWKRVVVWLCRVKRQWGWILKYIIIVNSQIFSVVPNYCWYANDRYECGLSLSCVFSGAKALDLCNGGMIWSCCVPRDRVGAQVRAGIMWAKLYFCFFPAKHWVSTCHT